MVDECVRHGNKPPELTVGDGDFTVKFSELEFIPGRDDYVGRNGEKDATNDPAIAPTINVAKNVARNVANSPTVVERRVLAYLAENPTATQDDAANSLGVSRGRISNMTRSLQDKGLLHREGSRKKGYWVVMSGGEADE